MITAFDTTELGKKGYVLLSIEATELAVTNCDRDKTPSYYRHIKFRRLTGTGAVQHVLKPSWLSAGLHSGTGNVHFPQFRTAVSCDRQTSCEQAMTQFAIVICSAMLGQTSFLLLLSI